VSLSALMIAGCSTLSTSPCPPSPALNPPSELLITPVLMPRYEGAEGAEDVAVEQGRIATDTRDRLIRLQEWVKGKM
jgi:hypothetical protein